MESLFLAQLLGVYFVIVGVVVLLRRGSLMPALSELAKNRPLILILALLELFAGIAIVLAYPNISFDWMGIIAVVGWMLIVEGFLYMATPFKEVQKFMKSFNTPTWYTAGGIVAILAGAYLINAGFGLMLF